QAEAERRDGEVDEASLLERYRVLWPNFFVDPKRAMLPPPERVGVQVSIEANQSLSRHFEQGTLANGLPGAALPALFVHGELSPLPVRTSTATAALIRGAQLEVVPGAGHFPWVERPGAVRDAIAAFLEQL